MVIHGLSLLLLAPGICQSEVPSSARELSGCSLDDNYDYIVNYLDDRNVDDIPNDVSYIKPGFQRANANYIGEQALNDMDFASAELCAADSSCSTYCMDITDANLGTCTCSQASSLNTPLKKLIGQLAGLCDGSECISWYEATIMKDADDHFACEPQMNYKRFARWGKEVQWHGWGWGLTLYRASRGNWEFGYHPDSDVCWSLGRPDYRQFFIRTVKPLTSTTTTTDLGPTVTITTTPCTLDGGDFDYILDYTDDRNLDDIPDDASNIKDGFRTKNAQYIGEAALNNMNFTSAELCVATTTCTFYCMNMTDANLGSGTCSLASGLNTPLKQLIGALAGLCDGQECADGEGPGIMRDVDRHFDCMPYEPFARISRWDSVQWHAWGWGVTLYRQSEGTWEFGYHPSGGNTCWDLNRPNYTRLVIRSPKPRAPCDICSSGTNLLPQQCAVYNTEPDGSGVEVYNESGYCIHTCEEIYDSHMDSNVTEESCSSIQAHYTGAMGCCIPPPPPPQCMAINMTAYERLQSKGYQPVNCTKK